MIYIPIWFYSNKDVHYYDMIAEIFTFQYGSIQIGRVNGVNFTSI